MSEMIKRVDLFQAWHNHIHNEFQDPELQKKHLDSLVEFEPVENTEALKKLSDLFTRAQRLQDEIKEAVGEKMDELKACTKQIDPLKKEVAAEFKRSVTNGVINFKYSPKTPSTDYNAAFKFLGGEKALKEQGYLLSKFYKKTNLFQTSLSITGGKKDE